MLAACPEGDNHNLGVSAAYVCAAAGSIAGFHRFARRTHSGPHLRRPIGAAPPIGGDRERRLAARPDVSEIGGVQPARAGRGCLSGHGWRLSGSTRVAPRLCCKDVVGAARVVRGVCSCHQKCGPGVGVSAEVPASGCSTAAGTHTSPATPAATPTLTSPTTHHTTTPHAGTMAPTPLLRHAPACPCAVCGGAHAQLADPGRT